MKKQSHPNPAKNIVVGVTGSFGSGKSTVSRIFGQLGAQVIDADNIAHDSMRQGTKTYKTLVRRFSAAIVGSGKRIDRSKLAAIVFGNKKALRELNALTHPKIIGKIRRAIRSSKKKAVIIDAPLLIETGLHKEMDKVIVVRASKKNSVEREKKKSGMSEKDILKRINAQVSLSRKVRLADFVIDNSGKITETRKQVKKIWKELFSPPINR